MANSPYAEPGTYRLRFAEYAFNVRTLELSRMGKPLTLQPRPARVLAVLVQARGELVTPGELRREVWGEHLGIHFEQSLKTCIKQVRSALGDDARAPRFVETLPRRGYRFIAPVQAATERTESELAAEPGPQADRVGARFSPREMALAGVIILLLLILAVLVLLGR